MVYTRLENRQAFYNRLFGNGRLASVGTFNKEGVLRAFDANQKKLGPDIKIGKDAHKLLAKLYPTMFSPPQGYERGVHGGRLVATRKQNVARGMKAADFKELGLTKKEGYRLSKILKKKDIPLGDGEHFKKLLSVYKRGQKEKIARFAMTNYQKFWVKQMTSARARRYQGSEMSWQFVPKLTYKNIHQFHTILAPYLQEKLLEFQANSNRTLKFQYNQWVTFEMLQWDEERSVWVVGTTKRSFFRGPVEVVLNGGQIQAGLNRSFAWIQELINKYIMQGSGWRVQKIEEAYINIYKYDALKGGSYVALPKWVQDKKACVNIQNKDNRCFFYCLLTALHENQIDLKHVDRLEQFEPLFQQHPELDETDLPMPLDRVNRGIPKYEHLLERNIHVLTVDEDNKKINTYHASECEHEETIVLLYYRGHYVLVKNVSRLISKQAAVKRHSDFLCMRCLHFQLNKKAYDKHVGMCKNQDVCRVSMPTKDSLTFDSAKKKKQLRQPFVIYADTEAILQEEEEQNNSRVQNKHVPCGAHYVIVSHLEKDVYGNVRWLEQGKVIRQFFDRSPQCIRKFLDQLTQDCRELYYEYLCNSKDMIFTAEDQIKLDQTTECHICGEGGFVSSEEDKQYRAANNGAPHPDSVDRDHDHLTGLFRGKAHHSCNLDYHNNNIFACLFHNLRGYDANFILKEIRDTDSKNVKVLALNTEKFLSFSLSYGRNMYEIRFVDSASFLSSSLEKLAEGLTIGEFVRTKQMVQPFTRGKSSLEAMLMLRLMIQKGVYCYEYMTEWKRFAEKQLPEIHAFISRLTYETAQFNKLTEKQQAHLKERYRHAHIVWTAFGCSDIGDYHDLYLHSDVALLADVFEVYRDMSMEKFGLDPCNYYTLPGIAFDSMLKKTGVELELLHDLDKYLMWEDGKIGGISGTGGVRYAKANNPYVPGYDETKPNSYLMYCDANALYGWGMTNLLPVRDFEFIDPADWNDKEFRMRRDAFGKRGYYLEVDAYLPEELHDVQNDYPCFPENVEVQQDQLSEWQKSTLQMMSHTISGGGQKKLVPNVNKKTNYKVMLYNLQLWESLGWQVTKVHRVMAFTQEAFVKPFIDLCSKERQKAETEFQKDFFKLVANANYGKFLENVRNHSTIKLVQEHLLQKYINKPDFKGREPINEHGIYMVDRKKMSVVLDKPVYAGIAILNLAKYKMYNFWYNVLQKKYGYDKLKMVYTDTDSFIFWVQTDDLYKDLEGDKEFAAMWDFSNYDKNHPLYDKSKKKVPGLFKDELAGVAIAEVVALRAKMYSILDAEGEQKNTGKGIKRAVLKKLKHGDYKRAQFHGGEKSNFAQSAEMTTIRSHNHNMVTESGMKKTLSCYDDKKWIHPDGITQYSHGHWRIGLVNLGKMYDAMI